MNESKSKNNIFYMILLILTMIIMIIGITFTYFSLLQKEKDDSTRIQTGTLSINYIDGREINTYSLLPITDPDLNTKYSTYKKEFTVTSDGTLDQYLNIYIDITNNEFNSNSLGYALYDKDGNLISKGTIPKSGQILIGTDIYLKSNSSLDFTVLIWLRENNQNQDDEQGKTFTGGFSIDGKQVKYE